MEKKIGRLVLFYWLFQFSAVFAIYKIFNTDKEIFSAFLIHITLWHSLLLLFLILYKGEFVNVENNLLLEKINLANAITLFRISSVPLIAFLLKQNEIKYFKIILAVVLILVFLTDFFDGFIARKFNQETKIGRMLDSMSDYSLLALVSIVYYQLALLPNWFFYLIFGRLMFQAIGMLFFMLLKFPVEIKSTKGGKITIAVTMIFYSLKMIQFFVNCPDNFKNFFLIAEYSCGFIIFVFLFEKVFIFYNHYKKYLGTKNKN
ncbi:CDP-alcohol phosphatidyltransferase family protein [Treponema putidum]|uniref:CDP-alcohol phosphatidyltransferase family protein n=1 Tax=Treponema putidum TaxID=221027 RepID=A0AAE9SM52_9SPIR|nr:CDP-alcohol phosphatidyltransferase family protein [Treponema putidum]AIN93297.1 CDP-alcohol phosphatidyltransferase [Treponema putidum]TWI76669.1 CDP-diacylglycerol--glycerol-3-phosphate 3-phosphatidyltransferase [Treponema putidum]UTY29537.1 CDP-alcohol phosphatidyltransferase family protein [Treponema putidum]UTY32021.1 CDP-alcohol phosphatidyltransferase family protein [Treponema putidum]UTY34399.1 CDP-alcohol phosphatidyltransferase family protein [Treponema putidum]